MLPQWLADQIFLVIAVGIPSFGDFFLLLRVVRLLNLQIPRDDDPFECMPPRSRAVAVADTGCDGPEPPTIVWSLDRGGSLRGASRSTPAMPGSSSKFVPDALRGFVGQALHRWLGPFPRPP